MKIAFVTDSGTGKSVGELAQAEIYSVPLQVNCLLPSFSAAIHQLVTFNNQAFNFRIRNGSV